LCQETKPINVKDGTNVLTASPTPGPSVGAEDVSYEIRASFAPVGTSLAGLNPAELQVLAWLRENRTTIANAEQKFRVDRRAIAGAIAWEMLENVIRNPRTDLSVGLGKVHTRYVNKKNPIKLAWVNIYGQISGDPGVQTIAKEAEELGYLPAQTFESRKAILATTSGAITYIAAIMAAIADIASRYKFDDIRSNPVILTHVYHGKTLKSWEAHLAAKSPGSSFSGGTPMALWVSSHLPFIEDGVGKPNLPESSPILASMMPPGTSPVGQFKTIVVVAGSSLSAIAKNEYGNFDLWPLIYDLNKAKIGPNPNLIAPGLSLSIAPLDSYTAEQIAWAKRIAPTWKQFR
jgi:hypothetical protein